MTIAHRFRSQSMGLAAFTFSRGHWFGPRHGLGLGGFFVVLLVILLIFLCVRTLICDSKTQ
jgi:hypothetical protein